MRMNIHIHFLMSMLFTLTLIKLNIETNNDELLKTIWKHSWLSSSVVQSKKNLIKLSNLIELRLRSNWKLVKCFWKSSKMVCIMTSKALSSTYFSLAFCRLLQQVQPILKSDETCVQTYQQTFCPSPGTISWPPTTCRGCWNWQTRPYFPCCSETHSWMLLHPTLCELLGKMDKHV